MADAEKSEEDVLPWGRGSIKKKIQLWESQEDVKKPGTRSTSQSVKTTVRQPVTSVNHPAKTVNGQRYDVEDERVVKQLTLDSVPQKKNQQTRAANETSSTETLQSKQSTKSSSETKTHRGSEKVTTQEVKKIVNEDNAGAKSAPEKLRPAPGDVAPLKSTSKEVQIVKSATKEVPTVKSATNETPTVKPATKQVPTVQTTTKETPTVISTTKEIQTVKSATKDTTFIKSSTNETPTVQPTTQKTSATTLVSTESENAAPHPVQSVQSEILQVEPEPEKSVPTDSDLVKEDSVKTPATEPPSSAPVNEISHPEASLDKQQPLVMANEPLHAPELVALVMGLDKISLNQDEEIAVDVNNYENETKAELEITEYGITDFTEIQYTFPNSDTDSVLLDSTTLTTGTSEEGFDDVSSVESGRASRRATLGSDVEMEFVAHPVPELTVTAVDDEPEEVADGSTEAIQDSVADCDSESLAEVSGVATPTSSPASPREYRKSVSHSELKTESYAAKLAALLYLRGINSKREFSLATSVDGAGIFADVVLKHKTDDGVWKTYYIQVRNKDSVFLTPEILTDGTNRFSLEESYESFRKIRSKTSLEDDDKVFHGNFEDTSFLIHTNAIAAEKLTLRLRPTGEDDVDNLLKSGVPDEGVINLHEESDKDIFQAHPEKRDFLRRLKIFVGQPSEIDLDHLIKMELRSACSKYLSNVHIIYRFFIEAVQQWWTYDETFLTQKVNILDKAESILNVYNLTARQKQLFKLPDINFKQEYTASWKEEFRKGSSLLSIQTTAMTSKFSSTKLMQSLWEEEVEYIFTSLPALLLQPVEVVEEWASGQKNLLVIVSESNEEHDELCDSICQVFAKKPEKRLVLLSPPFDPFSSNIETKYGAPFDEIFDPYDIMQLDKESTDQILEREVRFQGCPIYLRCVIGDDMEKTKSVLSANNFDSILYAVCMNVGTEVVAGEAPFIPRTIQRRDVVDRRILTSDDFWGIIAVSNITVDELKSLVPSGKKVGRVDDPNSKDFRFLALDSLFPEEEYYKLCESRKDVHWFHNKNGVLIWRRSQRNLKSMSRFIEDTISPYTPENILDIDDRVVLIIADPKSNSALLPTQLAVQTKLADPSLWVIQVHLDKLTNHLEQASSEDFNIVDFLALAALDKDATEMERDMLRFSVEVRGNVAVFLDGLDAIVPRYLRASLALLSSLLHTKISKVLVMAQTSLKDMLESHLATFAYEVCPDDKMEVETDA